MSGRATRALKFVLTPVVALSVGALGFQAFDEFSSEREVETPFRTVAAQSSLGMRWLEGFVSQQPFTHPSGGDPNKWRTISANRTLLEDDSIACAAPQPMPPLVADVKAGANNTVVIIAAITQPGMAKSVINDYEQRASDCNIKFSRISNEEITIGSNTTLLFYGDSIVSITFNKNSGVSNSDRNEIIDETRQKIITSLQDSQCVSVETSVQDRERNIYYTVNNQPKGLFVTEEVRTTVDTANLPRMVDVEPKVVNYPNLTKPEGPYPSGFPDAPEKRQEPNIPPLPQISNDAYTREVTYEAPDFDGAGCGWNWALGQKTPQYDVESLEAVKENTKNTALKELNENASTYVNNYLSVLAERVSMQGEVVKWNNYVDTINNVHNTWIELENRREEIRPSYQQYVDNHNRWSTFDDRKQVTQELFERKVEFCEQRDEEYLEWLEDGGEENSPPPAVCGELNPPSILSQTKGPEPTFSVPEGVTIPESWTKPGVNLQSIVRTEKANADREYQQFVNSFERQDAINREEWEQERRQETETPTTTPSTTTPSTTTTRTPEPTPAREPTPNPLDDLINLLP